MVKIEVISDFFDLMLQDDSSGTAGVLTVGLLFAFILLSSGWQNCLNHKMFPFL